MGKIPLKIYENWHKRKKSWIYLGLLKKFDQNIPQWKLQAQTALPENHQIFKELIAILYKLFSNLRPPEP